MITSEDISKLEAELGYKLPSSYKAILLNPPACVLWMWASSSWGYPSLSELDNLSLCANELLQTAGHQLNEGDFVFYMHEGYMFWYMKSLDEKDDPEVWEFCEGDDLPHKVGDSFTSWFNRYCQDIEKERAVRETELKSHFRQIKK